MWIPYYEVGNSEEKFPKDIVGRLSASCHLTADRWLTGDWISANCQPMVWRWIKHPILLFKLDHVINRTVKNTTVKYVSLLFSLVGVLDQFLAYLIL